MADDVYEGDVETRIIVPAIEELGYPKTQVESKHQVTFYVGRKANYGFSDYNLFLLSDDGENVYTVVIEAKRPAQNWPAARSQARSYATSSQINAPFYIVFDDSRLELFDHRFPKDPVLAGAVEELHAGSSLMDKLRAWISPLAAARFLKQNWGLQIPNSVMGELSTVQREIADRVQQEQESYIGGQVVGRDSVIDAVLKLADLGSGAVIAVTGALGVGKSAVATEVYKRTCQEAKAVYYFSKVNPIYNEEGTFYRFLCAQLFPVTAPERVPEIARAHSLKDLFWSTMKGLCDEQHKLATKAVIIVDGIDLAPGNIAHATVGVISSLAHECNGLTVIVVGQPPLPSSVRPTVDPIQIGLLDTTSAAFLWDRARNPRQPVASALGAVVPTLPIKMKIVLQSEGGTMDALIKNAGDDIEEVFGEIWGAFTDRQKRALAFVCTDFINMTKQELAALLNLAPTSRDFKRDFESVRRLLESNEPLLFPIDASLRGFVGSQLNEEQTRGLWRDLFTLREGQAEKDGGVLLYPYIERALGADQFPKWVRIRLQQSSSSDYNALDSVWDKINLPDYGEEGQLRLDAALKTSIPFAGHNRKQEFADWLVRNPNRVDEFRGKLLGAVTEMAGDESRAAVQCLVLMGHADKSVLSGLRMLVEDTGQDSESRAAGIKGLLLLGSKQARVTAIGVLSDLIRDGGMCDQVLVAGSICADPSLLSAISEALSIHAESEYRTDFAVSMMAAIAERNLEDEDIQSKVACILARLQDRMALGTMALSPQVSGSIDDPSIADTLLSLLDPAGEFTPSRHLIYLRTAELALPNPLARLPEAARILPAQVADIVRHDVTDDSENSGRFKNWQYKDWATQFICFCALRETMDWLAQVLDDSSPHVVHWACDYVGVLCDDAIVPRLAAILEKGSHSRSKIGAARALGAIATCACVEPLITHPPEIDGKVLQDGADALAESAISSGSVGRLCEAAADQDLPENCRAVCIAAIEKVAYVARDTISAHRQAIWTIIDSVPDQEWWAIFCLRALCALDKTDDEVAKVLRIARAGDTETSWAAMQVLAAWDELGEHHDLIARVKDAFQGLQEDRRRSETTLLTLYKRQPTTYAHMVAKRIFAESVPTLLNASLGLETPVAVRKALIRLLNRGRATVIAQADIITIAAYGAPREFLARLQENPPFELVPQYGPDLADALASIVDEHDDLRLLVKNEMMSLCAFPDLATRCSAANALANLDQGALVTRVGDLIGDEASFDSMVSGADCLPYIRSDKEFVRLIERVEFSPFPKLRIYSRLIRRERCNFALADGYVEKLQQITNDNILQLWRYGRAIVHIGERSHYSRLRQMARDLNYPRRVRFWFEWLAKDGTNSLTERLKKRQRDLES